MNAIQITKEQAYEMYNDMINECNEAATIGYITFEPARILKELDPIAYQCGFNDYFGSMEEEYEIID